MNYKEELTSPGSLRRIDSIVNDAINSPENINEIFKLISETNLKIAWKAAWVCHKISEKDHNAFIKQQAVIIQIVTSSQHSGLQRECLSILLNTELNHDVPVVLINFCLDNMVSPQSAIAVQALCMKLMLKITLIIPELAGEFYNYLDNIDPSFYSTGFNSCRKNCIKKLVSSKLI